VSAQEEYEYLVEHLLHPYICEGCSEDVPLTEREYRKALDEQGRLLCERCLEDRVRRRGTRLG